jgi:hypothetical protein
MEKFSSFSGSLHMRDDFCYGCFVVFFGVLFIEDTVGFVAKADASEEIIGIMTIKTIIYILTFPTIYSK